MVTVENSTVIATHQTRVMHIYIYKLKILTNDGLSIGLLGKNFSEIWIKLLQFSNLEINLKVSSKRVAIFCASMCLGVDCFWSEITWWIN